MARSSIRVLFAGETWVVQTTEIKGIDFFTQYGYGEGYHWLKNSLERSGIEVVHMPNHEAIREFPARVKALADFQCVILSDIGSNTLLLHPDTTHRSLPTPNRLVAVADYVRSGGSLLMIGGYMSFQGIYGRARYHNTAIEEVLPVQILEHDDRVEVPEGFEPVVVRQHPILSGLPTRFPPMLSYNQTIIKPNSELLIRHQQDPILAVADVEKGRTAAFMCDMAPHGATPEFLEWEFFDTFSSQLIRWLVRE